MLTFATISLLIMVVWTGSISQTVNSQLSQSATATFQYVDDDPVEGQVTVESYKEMYEGVYTPIFFNISLIVQGHTPMYLEIRSIEFLFSPLDLENRTTLAKSGWSVAYDTAPT